MNDRIYKKENIDGERGKFFSFSFVVVFIFYMVKSFGFYDYIIVVFGERWGRWSMLYVIYIIYICRYSYRKLFFVYFVRREMINDIF